MKDFLSKIKARVGDLWWYSSLLFIGQRLGEVINLYVGMVLVPKYVPQAELGAVLPLQQAVSFVGLPLGILAIPLMKFLGIYAEKGEYGKIKSLLRDVFIGSAVLAVFVMFLAEIILPFAYTRVRVVAGSLTILIVFCTIANSLSTIFFNAVNGLKIFSPIIWQAFLSAPARLVAMTATMPFRPLSGYFVGQCAAPFVTIVFSVWGLRKRLWSRVKSMPYWHEDGKAMLKYMLPLIPWTAMTTITSTIYTLVIRHRLPDFESAGYYIISRFAEISMYVGSSFLIFLFPLVASHAMRDKNSLHLLYHSMLGSMGGGVLVSILLGCGGKFLLGLSPLWVPYQSFTWMMVLLGLNGTLALTATCFFTYEIAQNRFAFLYYFVPIGLLGTALLYCWTGLGFFHGILPASFIDFLQSFHPCSLSFIVWFMLSVNLLTFLCALVDLFWPRKRNA